MKSIKFVGNSVIPGIPGRDLTVEEIEEYGGYDYLVATGLYQGEKPPSSELTQLQGVGTARLQALNALGVYTLSDLVAAGTSHINAALDGTNESMIEDWKAQAMSIIMNEVEDGS